MSGLGKLFGRGRGSRGGATIIASDWETSIPDAAFRAALEAEGITSVSLLAAATNIDLTAHANDLQGANWNGIQHADSVLVFNITNCRMVGDPALIGQCATMTELRAFGNNPDSGGCAGIAPLVNLTYCNFGDGTFDGDIADLAPLTQLLDLVMLRSNVTGNISVHANFPNLTRSHFGEVPGVTGDLGVFNNCPDLEKVYFYGTGVNAATSPSFTTQANLATLWLHNASLNEAAVDAILGDCETSLGVAGRVVCDLRLDGNAPPSAAGEADQDTLEAAGWTVQTDTAGGGEPTAILDYAVQDPPPTLSTEAQKWYDRCFNSANGDPPELEDFPVLTGDNMRRHNNIRNPLMHLAMVLAASKRKAILEFIDDIGERLWNTLDYGYRHTPSGSVWNDGDHILDGDGVIDSSKLLIFVNRTEQSSSFSDDTEGTNLSYSMATGRWTHFTTLLMEIYRQNASVSLPASAQRTRTSKETSLPPDGSGVTLANITETTYGHRFARWEWYHLHHLLPEWNRYHQLYEPWADAGHALDDPFGVGYMKGLDKSSYHSDGGDAMAINYYLWKATGVQKYEDAAKELVDFYLDVWQNDHTTDLGRTGFIMPRNFRDHGDDHIGWDSGGNCWSGYLRPIDYFREDIARLAHLQITGWYRFSDDTYLRRIHHTMADHVFADSVTGATDGIPTNTSWVMGTDVGGHQTRRFGWTNPDTQEDIWLEHSQDNPDEGINICQSFNQQGLSRLDSSPYLLCLPWRDAGTHEDRMRDIANGVYNVEHGSGNDTPDRIGAATALLLDAVVNDL